MLTVAAVITHSPFISPQGTLQGIREVRAKEELKKERESMLDTEAESILQCSSTPTHPPTHTPTHTHTHTPHSHPPTHSHTLVMVAEPRHSVERRFTMVDTEWPEGFSGDAAP